MKILVTGATGFLGRHVAERLEADGHQLVLQGARSAPPSTGARRGVRTGPLETFPAWSDLLDGVDLVVNLAGRAHVLKETAADPEAEFRAANETSVVRLTEAMEREGVKRLIHISSVAAKFGSNAYGRSKQGGEAAIAEWVQRSAGAAVILRPPLIYGAEAPGNLARLIRLIRLPVPLPIKSVDNRRSLLAVENAADAVARIAGSEMSGVSTYEICDDDQVSLPQIVGALSRGMGTAKTMVPFPSAILSGGLSLLSRQMSDGLFGDLVLDNRPLKDRFSWTPRIATLDGLERMGRSLASPEARP